MITPNSILMVPKKHFPCQHAMLETVYTCLLSNQGYNVSWLMPSAEVNKPTKVTWNGSQVYQFPTPAGGGLSGFLSRRTGELQLLAYLVGLSWRQRFQIIQVRNAIVAGFIAWLAARLTGARFVFQFSFPLPEILIEKARKKQRPIAWLLITWGRLQMGLRNWLMRRADLVLAISEEMRRDLLALGLRPGQVAVFPLGTDCPSEPDVACVAEARARLGVEHRPVVLYFGEIAPERELDFLLRVATRVREQHAAVRFLLVGPASSNEERRLRSYAHQLGIADTVIFTGAVPRIQIPIYLALANVSVSPIPPTPTYWVSSPTKVVESLAMGCAVVATDIPDSVEVISNSGGGLVTPFEEEAFAQAICRLLSDPDLAARAGESGKVYVREHRSYEVLASQLHGWYQRILQRP